MYYATKTTNKSFISMWRYLQRNNIDNNLFMLQTKHAELVDFSIEKYKEMDRDDPSFVDYKNMIIDEVRNNIWFYFRELVVEPDSQSITGYSHFQLNPESMMMIYLYDNGISFINRDNINESCLQFLWNFQKSRYHNDLVIMNNMSSIETISNIVRKHIAQMDCQVLFGSSQIMTDNSNHYIGCTDDYIRSYGIKNSLNAIRKTVDDKYNTHIKLSNTDTSSPVIFLLENNMSALTYSIVLNAIQRRYPIYFNGKSDQSTIEYAILYNTLLSMYPIATTEIYDIQNTTQLNQLYII